MKVDSADGDLAFVESIDIETTNYSKTTRIWPHNMLLWLPEITIDRGHSTKAHSPTADSDSDTCIFNSLI